MTEKEIKLVEENIGLAVHTANRWADKTGLEWEDAVSAANYGLVKAAMSFKEERGIRFSTYAVRVMENEICMELRNVRKRTRIKPVYFDDPINEEGLTLGDTIADDRDCFAVVEELDALERRSISLTERERTALRLRLQYPEKRQKDYARMMGVQQSMISRYMKGVKRKLVGQA